MKNVAAAVPGADGRLVVPETPGDGRLPVGAEETDAHVAQPEAPRERGDRVAAGGAVPAGRLVGLGDLGAPAGRHPPLARGRHDEGDAASPALGVVAPEDRAAPLPAGDADAEPPGAGPPEGLPVQHGRGEVRRRRASASVAPEITELDPAAAPSGVYPGLPSSSWCAPSPAVSGEPAFFWR